MAPSGSPDSQHPVLTWNAKRLEFVSGTGLPGALPALRVSGGIAGTLVMALVMIVFVFWAIGLGHFGGAAVAGATIWLILILAIKFVLLDLVYLPYKLKRLYFAHVMTNGTGFSLLAEDKRRLGAAKCDSSYLSRSFFAGKAGLRLGAFLGLVGSALILFIVGDMGNAITCLVIGAIVWFFTLSGSKGDKLDKRLGKLDETLSA